MFRPLDQGEDVHYVDYFQNNLLHSLLKTYYIYDTPIRRDLLIRRAVELIDAGIDINQLNKDKDTPLSIAASNGLYEVVWYMLEHGGDIHYVDGHKNNLIHILSYSFDMIHNRTRRSWLVQCVVKLVDAGVDVNQVNDGNETPIVIAARKGLSEVMTHLLKHGVDINYVDDHHNNLIQLLLYGYTPEVNTGLDDLLKCVVRLVKAGVDVNQLNKSKDTPISIAARKGWRELVMYMLEHGGDKDYVDGDKNNLMHTLLYSYSREINTGLRDLFIRRVVELVKAGVDVNQLNKSKDTPLSIAASKGLYGVVKYMLDHGGDKHYVDNNKNNLMHILLYSFSRGVHTSLDDLLKCVVRLVKAGVDVNQVNTYKDTPIFLAASKGLYEVVIYMLKHGVDIRHVDNLKRNILHYVLWYMHSYLQFEEKYIQLVNTLVNTGLDINQPDCEGNSPLFYVGINKPFSLSNGIPMKLDRGPNIRCLLQCKLISIILEAGCNVNHRNKLGRTALMHHIKHQADISVLKLLIPHSDLSLTDNNGNTAISYCVKYHMFNSTIVFKLLVDSGSDLMSRNNGVKLFQDILKCKRSWLFSNYMSLKLIVNGVTAEGENMLHLLAGVNYDYCLKKFNWLLNNELDINQPCFKANTPTMVAAFLLNSKYLELLTRHPRLDINAQNNQGHTALHCCIIGFTMFKDGLNKRQVNDVVKNYCWQIYPIYMACIDMLLGVDGIDVNIPDNGGRTSLMMASLKNDRVLTRKLLQAGAIVTMLDYSRRSALQYLDIYQSDLTCFKLLLSNGNTGLLNIPCIDGNTIIQTVLCFPFFWEPCRVVCFIRYLVAENCCLQNLENSSVESSYNQIDLNELSHLERQQLRQLLYLSGALGKEIMTSLNFVEEDKEYEDNDTVRPRGREEFINFCSHISLKSLCRRIIRPIIGLEIQKKVRELELPRELKDFLLLKDVLQTHDYNLDHIDDGCNYFDGDDDYDGYDIDDRDDDYSQYKYQYFTLNTDHELRQYFLDTYIFPNGESDNDDFRY